MRKALTCLHAPTAVLTGVFLLIALSGAGAAWWFNERVPILEGGVPLAPRSSVASANHQSFRRAMRYNYACNTPRRAKTVEEFYRSRLRAEGWVESDVPESGFLFRRGGESLRIVINQQRFKTVFTLHLRQPHARRSPSR